jgi:hypothetical protein
MIRGGNLKMERQGENPLEIRSTAGLFKEDEDIITTIITISEEVKKRSDS